MTAPPTPAVSEAETRAAIDALIEAGLESRVSASSIFEVVEIVLTTAANVRPSAPVITDGVAQNFVELGNLLDQMLENNLNAHYEHNDTDTKAALLELLWDNKVGIIRALQSYSTKGPKP